MSVYWSSRRKMESNINSAIRQASVVLNIGAGINPQEFKNTKSKVHLCLEPFDQYVKKLQENILLQNKSDKYVVIKAYWDEVVKIFPSCAVDAVYLIDVIEHLPKNKALELIKKTEKIARKQIVIFTPLGFMPQTHPDGKDAWGLNGGKMQEHKSGWFPNDFDDTWDIFATKKFHVSDNDGNFYKKPYGAFYAVKNISLIKTNYYSQKEKILIKISNIFLKIIKRIKRLLNFKRFFHKI